MCVVFAEAREVVQCTRGQGVGVTRRGGKVYLGDEARGGAGTDKGCFVSLLVCSVLLLCVLISAFVIVFVFFASHRLLFLVVCLLLIVSYFFPWCPY